MTEIKTNSWIEQTGTEGGSNSVNFLEDYTLLKVYNPMIGGVPDIELDGQIVQLSDDGWKPFAKELSEVKVITLTKCYKGYATKLENGQPVLDDGGKAVTELYYTPEVSVYDKNNIAIAKNTENGPKVLGKGGFKSYIDFTTSMKLEDGTLNPLFNTIGTNSSTGEKYPISIMKQEYSMYFEMAGALYKIRLGASYGRWKDVQEGTFLDAKNKGVAKFKTEYPTMNFEFYYLTLDASVKKADKYKYIEWTFKNITEEDILSTVKKTTVDVESYNMNNFPGVTIGNGMEQLPFDMNRLMLTTSEKVADIIDEVKEEDITVPF